MISCKEATELMSRRMDEKLSWWKKLLMWSHLLYCSGCRLFLRQLSFLKAACRSELTADEQGLSAAARAKLLERIREIEQQQRLK